MLHNRPMIRATRSVIILLLMTPLFISEGSFFLFASLSPSPELPIDFKMIGDITQLTWEGRDQNKWGEAVTINGETRQLWRLPSAGWTYEKGKPLLPMIARFIIIPPQGGVQLQVSEDERVTIHHLPPPLLCDDPQVLPVTDEPQPFSLYPPQVAELSPPIIFRGIRLVKLTLYPFQYDLTQGEYIYHRRLQVEIVPTGEVGENEVVMPFNEEMSPHAVKFLQDVAEPLPEWLRDIPPEKEPRPGHYLVVAHRDALLWHIPFIEWRRKMGYKVDIYAVPANQANNPDGIRTEIRNRYNAYRQNGQEPFDHILIIGDRTTYDNRTAAPQYVITPFTGNSIWGSGGPHADYAFGLLEGNDDWPDVAVSRFPSGSQAIANLVVNRTLAYIATPRMQNPEWFLRGAVYSQHWGNNATSAWHVTIATNVRWAEEVLKNKGFTDVAFYENYAWDQMGQNIGPFLRDQLNRGVNVLTGRAENYYWRDNFQGVNNNTVFPIKICLSGHGEWTAYNMFRTGDGNNLKGPVAMTFSWGGPPTAPMSYIWMEMTNATINKNFTLGWARTLGITKIERYFPNINVGRNLYDHVKTDVDIFGDPAIQPWFGVPTQVSVTHPTSISPQTKSIVVRVRDGQNRPVSGAIVTLYAPGNIPTNDPTQYANWNQIVQINRFTDSTGSASFTFSPDFQFQANTRVYLTVSGRSIRPWSTEITVTTPNAYIDVAGISADEVEGNGDESFNPGEIWELRVIARNLGNRDLVSNLMAIARTSSPYLELEADTLHFGEIRAGETQSSQESIRITFRPWAPDSRTFPQTQPIVNIIFMSGNQTWNSALGFPLSAPALSINQVIGGGVIGYNAQNITLELINRGSVSSPPLNAQLVPRGIGITVINNRTTYPSIAPGRTSRPNGNALTVTANRLGVPGSSVEMLLILSHQDGFTDTIPFTLQCSQSRQNAPQGPDRYGYICFDDTDTDWDMAPRYRWIEISTREQIRDFNGTLINFRAPSPTDTGEVRVLDLPFETQFYGRVYNRITVSTNGYIAMGAQPRVNNFQNWPLDQGIGGGVGMIAPYWDDIRLDQNSGVYYYYDRDNGRFIIEWYKLRPASGNAFYTFQVILLDRRVWITETGDQNILFQYKEVTPDRNIRAGDTEWVNNIPYASVGISSPDGTTGISYVFNNNYPVSSAPLQARRAILFTTALTFRSGTLTGTVHDAANNRPLVGAVVFTHHGFTATTDQNGRWTIRDALAEVPFTITARKEGYNDSTLTDIILHENDTLEINFSLLHPEFTLNVDSLVGILPPDEDRELEFELYNGGNGPLNWSVSKQLIGEANVPPWQVRRSYGVGNIVDDDRIEGVAFDGRYFYLAGANGDAPNTIYVLNREGELIDTFPQPGQSVYGMRDLEWDGELLWGSGERNIYGFTPAGEVRVQFRGPVDPNYAIAYDSQNNLLWIANLTGGDIYAYDRQGNALNRIIQRRGLRLYGLAYNPQDPDGYFLYAIHRANGPIMVYKYNPLTSDTLLITDLAIPNATTANGLFISNQYDHYSWVLMTIGNVPRNQGGDQLLVYQLDSRRDWFDLNLQTGTLTPNQRVTLTLTLSSHNLPEATFRGELLFTHNAAEGRTILPITLYVRHTGPRDIRVLDLKRGWNTVSLNIAPPDSLLPVLTQPLREAGVLQMVKDGRGHFYRPEVPFNNIPYWDARQGYQLYLSEDFRWQVLGTALPPDSAIPLSEGWNLVSYLPRFSLPAPIALRSIAHHLIIAKDPNGQFYLPAYDYSNMELMREGRGYFLKMAGEGELVYTAGEQLATLPSNDPFLTPTHFTPHNPSGANFSLLILTPAEWAGSELGVVDKRGVLRGGGIIDARGRCGIPVWEVVGSDTIIEKSPLTSRLWDGYQEWELTIEPLEGEIVWERDGWGVARAALKSPIPNRFALLSLYPNPFNGSLRFSLNLPTSGVVDLYLYDITGARVVSHRFNHLTRGEHPLVLDLSHLPDGLYLLNLRQGDESIVQKVVMVK